MIRRSTVAVKRHAQHVFWRVSEGGFIMNNGIHWFLGVLCAIVFVVVAAHPALAQDAVKVDPQHYKVEVENAQVRVLRITYGPHEKSVMHGHPASVAVFLTDANFRFTLPDGKTEEPKAKAGEIMWGMPWPPRFFDTPFTGAMRPSVLLGGKSITASRPPGLSAR